MGDCSTCVWLLEAKDMGAEGTTDGIDWPFCTDAATNNCWAAAAAAAPFCWPFNCKSTFYVHKSTSELIFPSRHSQFWKKSNIVHILLHFRLNQITGITLIEPKTISWGKTRKSWSSETNANLFLLLLSGGQESRRGRAIHHFCDCVFCFHF